MKRGGKSESRMVRRRQRIKTRTEDILVMEGKIGVTEALDVKKEILNERETEKVVMEGMADGEIDIIGTEVKDNDTMKDHHTLEEHTHNTGSNETAIKIVFGVPGDNWEDRDFTENSDQAAVDILDDLDGEIKYGLDASILKNKHKEIENEGKMQANNHLTITFDETEHDAIIALPSKVVENFDKDKIRKILEKKEKKVGEIVLVNGRPAVIKKRISHKQTLTGSDMSDGQKGRKLKNITTTSVRQLRNPRRRVRVKVRAKQGISVEDIEDQLVVKQTSDGQNNKKQSLPKKRRISNRNQISRTKQHREDMAAISNNLRQKTNLQEISVFGEA
eukprot:GFUD01000927.1.p1 GENE.GFUD01000927.1~~GFUD01000927.1.p1  ORF type:complete len:333 (+),score=108.99 GFUD01000927.1:311-1309(+)